MNRFMMTMESGYIVTVLGKKCSRLASFYLLLQEAERESLNRTGKKVSLHSIILENATDKQKTHKA